MVRKIIEASLQMQVEKVIYVSTDKAADPSNTYGMTKAIGEKLMVHANVQTKKTKFILCSWWKCFRTSGSVVPLFKTN